MQGIFNQIFWGLVILGFFIGLYTGYSASQNNPKMAYECVEQDELICIRMDWVPKNPNGDILIAGLVGAFVGGWAGVLVSYFEK